MVSMLAVCLSMIVLLPALTDNCICNYRQSQGISIHLDTTPVRLQVCHIVQLDAGRRPRPRLAIRLLWDQVLQSEVGKRCRDFFFAPSTWGQLLEVLQAFN